MYKVENTTPFNVIVSDGHDGYTEVIIFPAGTKKEVAEQVFNDDYYMERPKTMCDCTGKMFTNGHSVYVHREATIIIHSISCDI